MFQLENACTAIARVYPYRRLKEHTGVVVSTKKIKHNSIQLAALVLSA